MKQFQRIIGMEGVELSFTKDALATIAVRAQKRKTGARGLRSMMEEVMLEVMYDLPSMTNVKKCVVNKDVIDEKAEALLVYQERSQTAKGFPYAVADFGNALALTQPVAPLNYPILVAYTLTAEHAILVP